jgi:hypothetical protein
MNKLSRTGRSVAELADAFVLSRMRGSVVSTRDAIRGIRFLAPICEHTDTELAEIVARIAITKGRAVAFDHGERGWAASLAA